MTAIQTILFPAQAGVIPEMQRTKALGLSVPRASGGDPNYFINLIRFYNCSPRKRG